MLEARRSLEDALRHGDWGNVQREVRRCTQRLVSAEPDQAHGELIADLVAGQVLDRLWMASAGLLDGKAPIVPNEASVKTAVRNAYRRVLRQQYPERYKISCKLRDIVQQDTRFYLLPEGDAQKWKDSQEKRVGVPGEMHDPSPLPFDELREIVSHAVTMRIRDTRRSVGRKPGEIIITTEDLAALACEILHLARGTLSLKALVTLACDRIPLQDHTLESLDAKDSEGHPLVQRLVAPPSKDLPRERQKKVIRAIESFINKVRATCGTQEDSSSRKYLLCLLLIRSMFFNDDNRTHKTGSSLSDVAIAERTGFGHSTPASYKGKITTILKQVWEENGFDENELSLFANLLELRLDAELQ